MAEVELAPVRTHKVVQYGLAALGPAMAAGAQFVLSLQLLHALAPAEFGAFAFLLVLSQLSFGFSSALLGAPYPVLMSKPGADTGAVTLIFHAANAALSLVALAVFFGLGMALGLSGAVAVIFAAYAAIMLLRWFGRSYSYVHGRQKNSVFSDLTYGTLLLCGILAMFLSGTTSLLAAYAVLLLSGLAALVPLGGDFMRGQFLRFSGAALKHYGAVWNQHSKWSLSGVATTELTANTHAYVVTFILGPQAFAPLAASALLIRPIALVSNALTDFERPQIARKLGTGGAQATKGLLNFFSLVLFSTWGLSALLAIALIGFIPQVIFPPEYELPTLMLGTALWFLVTLMRTVRTPNSVLLQAAGQFRPLAYASYVSCGVSVAAVIVFTLVFGPVWSIAGVFLGEAVFTVQTARQTARWRNTLSGQP